MIELSRKKQVPVVSNTWPEPIKASILGPPPTTNRFVSKTSQDKNLPIKKMTTAEMEICRRQGLCYYRDDKSTPGQECKPKQLYLLSGEGDGEDMRTGPLSFDEDMDFLRVAVLS